MQQTTVDDLVAIEALWPSFEDIVGLKGRKMYARFDRRPSTYTVCTPLKPGDDPARLGVEVGTLPGGWYLRGVLVGEPPEVYGHIAAGVQELEALVEEDGTRPVIEFYRRNNEIEIWVPVRP